NREIPTARERQNPAENRSQNPHPQGNLTLQPPNPDNALKYINKSQTREAKSLNYLGNVV
ncbi:MAG: hypothetical protein ACU0BB_02635, partial [Paracoccaceae bacterium]